MIRETAIVDIQTGIRNFSSTLSSKQINNCSSYIKSLCLKYKARLFSALDRKLVFKLYDEDKRVRYLSFEFNNKIVTVKYGTKCNSNKIGLYIIV